MPDPFIIIVAVVACFALSILVFYFLLTKPWLRAFLNAAPVSIIRIFAMRLRGNPPTLLIDAYINLKHAGDSATIGEVEVTYIENRNRITISDDLVELVKERDFGHENS